MLPPSFGSLRASVSLIVLSAQCNGARPRCAFCLGRNIDCLYDTATKDETHGKALKRKYAELYEQKSTFEQIYEVLHGRPLDEASEIFRRIRGDTDPESVLRYAKEGDLLL
jgi:hypothetical protein